MTPSSIAAGALMDKGAGNLPTGLIAQRGVSMAIDSGASHKQGLQAAAPKLSLDFRTMRSSLLLLMMEALSEDFGVLRGSLPCENTARIPVVLRCLGSVPPQSLAFLLFSLLRMAGL